MKRSRRPSRDDGQARRHARQRPRRLPLEPEEDEPEHSGGRRQRRRRWKGQEVPASPSSRRDRFPAAERPITCHECANLVITRSFVKVVGQSWDNAVIYPTYSCFEQRWTLEDPASVEDPSAVSPYLAGNADQCPDFRRGQARDYRRHWDW